MHVDFVKKFSRIIVSDKPDMVLALDCFSDFLCADHRGNVLVSAKDRNVFSFTHKSQCLGLGRIIRFMQIFKIAFSMQNPFFNFLYYFRQSCHRKTSKKDSLQGVEKPKSTVILKTKTKPVTNQEFYFHLRVILLLFNAKCKEAYPFARLSAGSGHLRPSAYGAQKQASGCRKQEKLKTRETSDVRRKAENPGDRRQAAGIRKGRDRELSIVNRKDYKPEQDQTSPILVNNIQKKEPPFLTAPVWRNLLC